MLVHQLLIRKLAVKFAEADENRGDKRVQAVLVMDLLVLQSGKAAESLMVLVTKKVTNKKSTKKCVQRHSTQCSLKNFAKVSFFSSKRLLLKISRQKMLQLSSVI